MSLTGQTIRKIIPALAVCLVIFAPASKVAAQAIPAPPKKIGGSTIRGVVTYADTGRPLRNALVRLLANNGGEGSSSVVSDRRGEFVFEGTADLESDVDELVYFEPRENPDKSLTVSTRCTKRRALRQ